MSCNVTDPDEYSPPLEFERRLHHSFFHNNSSYSCTWKRRCSSIGMCEALKPHQNGYVEGGIQGICICPKFYIRGASLQFWFVSFHVQGQTVLFLSLALNHPSPERSGSYSRTFCSLLNLMTSPISSFSVSLSACSSWSTSATSLFAQATNSPFSNSSNLPSLSFYFRVFLMECSTL